MKAEIETGENPSFYIVRPRRKTIQAQRQDSRGEARPWGSHNRTQESFWSATPFGFTTPAFTTMEKRSAVGILESWAGAGAKLAAKELRRNGVKVKQ